MLVVIVMYVCMYVYVCVLVSRGGGLKGGAKVVIEAHRHEGVFIARSKEDALVTLNSTPGRSGSPTHT